MKIIALDLGSNMALAHNGFGDVCITDHKTFDGPRPVRFKEAANWLSWRFKEIIDSCGLIDLCIYERPFARGFDATRSGWGLAGIIEAAAIQHMMAVTDQTPQSVKSWALAQIGKKPVRKKMSRSEREYAKNQEKLAMLEVAGKLGYRGHNEHEADAFLLLKYTEVFAVKSKGKPHA